MSMGRLTKRISFFLLTFLLVLITGSISNAATLHNTSVDLTTHGTGSRTSSPSGGITATGVWDDGGFSIDWTITESSGVFTYLYTLKNLNTGGGGGGLSHWLLEISQGKTENDLTILQGTLDGTATEFMTGDSGNPLLPNNIYGLKFDTAGADTATIEFTSLLDPVWGNMYAKDGGGQTDAVVAYNNALAITGFDSSQTIDFIPRPDSGLPPPPPPPAEAPEPGVILLLGCGLLGVGRMARRRGGTKK